MNEMRVLRNVLLPVIHPGARRPGPTTVRTDAGIGRCRGPYAGVCRRIRMRSSCAMWLLPAAFVSLGESAAGASPLAPGELRAAIEKSLPLLQETAVGTSEHRGCFTCHGHAMPVLAMVEAQRRGFLIDVASLRDQLDHTVEDLKRGRERYLEGRGQGGGFIRAGYALWMLDEAGWKPDDITGVVSGYLVHDQKADHWRNTANRPPTEISDFTATFLALRSLDGYGTEGQQDRISERRRRAAAWLKRTKGKETEDSVFRLLALRQVNAGKEEIADAVRELQVAQRPDGGWSQLPGAGEKSDPYATGTVLYALNRAGGMAANHKSYERGVRYLLETQYEDGSWYVKSRSKPFQTYYESGYPHEKDQFVSMAAGSWATLALLFAAGDGPGRGQVVAP